MSDETTSEQLAEIEGQATEYTPPEGWRVLAVGEKLQAGDMWVMNPPNRWRPTIFVGAFVGSNQRYIRRIESEPQPKPQPVPQPVQVREGRWRTRGGEVRNVTPTPDDHPLQQRFPWWDQSSRYTWRQDGQYAYDTESGFDLLEYVGQIQQPQPEPEPQPEPQPQPVQVREGRWRTRGGEVKYIRAGGSLRDNYYSWPWTDGVMCWQDNGLYQASKPSPRDLVEYLGPFEQPDKVITPDDVAGEALAGAINEWPSVQIVRREVEELQAELGLAKRRVVELETLVADLRTINDAQEKAVSAAGQRNTDLLKLLDNKKRRISELETLVVDLRVSNEATEKAVRAAGRQNTDLQHRLDVVSTEWAEQAATINGLQQQLEAVKAELVQERLERNQWQNQAQRTETQLIEKISKCRNLQIELDALQQAPQAETAAAVPTSKDDRFEQGWDAGTARAVETIAEWTEPFRTCGSERLAWMVMQNLPHIMRSLTGLTDED